MSRRLLIIASMLLFSICAAPAQTPSPDAMTAARSLVTTMKLPDQYKALLPAILLGLRPALTQDRPEIERDYDAMMPTIEDAFTPYYTAMLNDVATVYANNFTVGELREMETFYRQPVGQKLLEKAPGHHAAEQSGRPGCQPQGGRGSARAFDRSAAPERAQIVMARCAGRAAKRRLTLSRVSTAPSAPRLRRRGSLPNRSLPGTAGSRFPGFDRRLGCLEPARIDEQIGDLSQPDPEAMQAAIMIRMPAALTTSCSQSPPGRTAPGSNALQRTGIRRSRKSEANADRTGSADAAIWR